MRCSGKTAAELPTWPYATADWIERIFTGRSSHFRCTASAGRDGGRDVVGEALRVLIVEVVHREAQMPRRRRDRRARSRRPVAASQPRRMRRSVTARADTGRRTHRLRPSPAAAGSRARVSIARRRPRCARRNARRRASISAIAASSDTSACVSRCRRWLTHVVPGRQTHREPVGRSGIGCVTARHMSGPRNFDTERTSAQRRWFGPMREWYGR